jgi:predicted DsbA family dithiol-disulfide isomerase
MDRARPLLRWRSSRSPRRLFPNPGGRSTVKVEIWSDVVCPWCYLGKRRFESALADFEHRDEVEVSWHSFELDPSAPREREVDLATHLAQKYGMTREEAVARQQQLVDLGADDGISYRFDIARSGNTFDAHRLLHLAAAHGRQGELKERLLRAYHTEGEPIGDAATLKRLAVEVGLPAEEVDAVLSSERYADEVREDERLATSFGAGGVPFFVIDRAIGLSGAQPREVFAELLERGWNAGRGAEAGSAAPAGS